VFTNGSFGGVVVERNFEPFSDQYSTSIDGILMTCQIEGSVSGGVTNAWLNIFPANPAFPVPATVANGVPGPGAFFTGLTTDDIGGLHYLYTTNNVTEETLLPDVQAVNGGTFGNAALRPGIDKITFVPQPAVDGLLGTFFQPLTNQFTDYYITNNTVRQQQLERVTVRPDFLFSVTNLAVGAAWVSRTGTTNWTNNVIPPPVTFWFNRLGPSWTSYRGSPDDSASETNQQWGSFDGSTNLPVAFPQIQTGTCQTPVSVTLMVAGAPVGFNWLVTGPTVGNFAFETSTNLSNWTTLFLVQNNGAPNSYLNENPSSTRRFYRIVPQ
jgi:hypothetical protein